MPLGFVPAGKDCPVRLTLAAGLITSKYAGSDVRSPGLQTVTMAVDAAARFEAGTAARNSWSETNRVARGCPSHLTFE
jgi:hypothetical protein